MLYPMEDNITNPCIKKNVGHDYQFIYIIFDKSRYSSVIYCIFICSTIVTFIQFFKPAVQTLIKSETK